MSLLGIDLGTSGVRAACYDTQGRMLASAVRATSLVHDGGIVTTDAEAVATAAESAIREVIAHSAVLEDPVASVSFSVQGEAVVPVDREGRALAPAPVSMDRRGMQAASDLGAQLGSERVQFITGQPLHPMFSVYKIAAGGPGWEGADVAGYRCLDGFVAERLGARAAIDYSMAARTGAFDVTTLAWSDEIIGRVRAGGASWLTAESLPAPVSVGTPIGEVSESASQRTGLAVGTPIVAGLHDQAASFLGAGGLIGDTSVFALGSSDCLTVGTPARPRGLERTGFASYPLADDLWITLAGTAAGGWALEWFSELIGKQLDDLFARPSATPPRLLVLPYFTGSGTLDNDPQARGVIAGLTLTTDRPQLVRAFLEATGFELAKILAAFEAAGIRVGDVRAVGSGASNRIGLDIRSSAAGIELSPVGGNAATRGAALVAGVGMGTYPGLSALPEPAPEDRSAASLPDPQYRAWYDSQRAAFRDLYLALIPTNRSLSHNEEKPE